MNWLWPRRRTEDPSVIVRIIRVIHWSAIGFAIFGEITTMYTAIQDPATEPLTYFVVSSLWVSVAMLGRGIRYIIARE